MQGYIIAHDVGTGGNKAVLITPEGDVRGDAFVPYGTTYPRPDWAEQNPPDWWAAISQSTQILLEKTGVPPGEVLAVVFSAQMLGVVPTLPEAWMPLFTIGSQPTDDRAAYPSKEELLAAVESREALLADAMRSADPSAFEVPTPEEKLRAIFARIARDLKAEFYGRP